MIKIAKSNVELDDGFIDTASVEKQTYEVLSPFTKVQTISRENNQQLFDRHDIS